MRRDGATMATSIGWAPALTAMRHGCKRLAASSSVSRIPTNRPISCVDGAGRRGGVWKSNSTFWRYVERVALFRPKMAHQPHHGVTEGKQFSRDREHDTSRSASVMHK